MASDPITSGASAPAAGGMPNTVRPEAEPAPAKLNLYLHVVGRRPDGYHLLDSLVVFASVADRITVAPAPASSLTVDGPFAAAVPPGEGNLALAAAERLGGLLGDRGEGPNPRGVAIALTKALPVAAGLGGGSADAAAVLRALLRLWDRAGAGLAPADPGLARLAESLGADVPACLAGQPRYVGGIGERLDPAPAVSGIPVVLVNPGLPLPTPAVFRARTGDFSSPDRFPGPLDGTAFEPPVLAALLADRRNDLTEAALTLCPAVGTVLAALTATSGCLLARMSGSGATCFGLFDRPASAVDAAAALARAEPGWWVQAGHLL